MNCRVRGSVVGLFTFEYKRFTADNRQSHKTGWKYEQWGRDSSQAIPNTRKYGPIQQTQPVFSLIVCVTTCLFASTFI